MKRTGLKKWLILLTILSFSVQLLLSQERLIKFPGQWEFLIPRNCVILTSDQQLLDLANPDRKINLSLSEQPKMKSLKDIAEESVSMGASTVIIAFDNFFTHYRGEQEQVRKLLPDNAEYIKIMKQISDYFTKYNLGLELSLINPIELGSSFVQKGASSGRWVQFKTAIRDPHTGQFSVDFWQQLTWTNNKGKFNIKLKEVKAFAFKEILINGGEFISVNPSDIKEIKTPIKTEEYPGLTSYNGKKIRVYSEDNKLLPDDSKSLAGYDRALVLLVYETPELDYFDPNALSFMEGLIKQYHDAGVRLNAFYSDEMHIQQDWGYSEHLDNGQFAFRFITSNMAKAYAGKYGNEFTDMDKYMLYFVNAPQIYLPSSDAVIERQYVMGETAEDIHKTILFRDRYYKLLSKTVVDLCAETKKYGERLYNKKMLAIGHATWAESPTIDEWFTDVNENTCKYEYTSNFMRSNTDHQAASACDDYFKWGDYFTGNGSDYPECGWLDRNYYGAAIAAGLGNINEYHDAYSGFWGMPDVSWQRKQLITSAYGDQGNVSTSFLNGRVHRQTDVLILYPQNLVAANSQFGSWVTQYGYADYITSEKLLSLGKVNSAGRIVVNGRQYTTLVSLFDVIPDEQLLNLMTDFSQKGGKVLWFGMPPLLNSDGQNCTAKWEDIFRVSYKHTNKFGSFACGKKVTFVGSLKGIPDEVILTHFIVDRLYPVELKDETAEIVAYYSSGIVGTKRKNGAGEVYFFGFRPRDDQSQSLGYESRTLFEILNKAGCYKGTGKFGEFNDNPDVISRTTEYLTTGFPNGTTVITPHYRTHVEDWDGGFQRNAENDKKALLNNPMPSDTIILKDFKVNGHIISFNGKGLLAFLTDETNTLNGFEGSSTNEVIIDNKTCKFSEKKLPYIFFSPIMQEQQLNNKAFYVIKVETPSMASLPETVSIPLKTQRKNLKLYKEGPQIGSKAEGIPFTYKNDVLSINITKDMQGKFLYLCGEIQ